MKDFDKYLARSKRITDEVDKSGNGLGMFFAWSMIIVGVLSQPSRRTGFRSLG